MADGFLIGDCVLLRPLLWGMVRQSRRVVYIGGQHADTLLSDIPAERLTFQWPWAVYDWRPAALWRLFILALRIFFLQPRCVVEPRGDMRSLAFLYLCCVPRIAGYSFTGGKFMIDVEPDVPGIEHLEVHNRRLAESLGLEYSVDDIVYGGVKSAAGMFSKAGGQETSKPGEIALSFSGSQPLKALPRATAAVLLHELSMRNKRMVYLAGPNDHFLSTDDGESLLKTWNVEIWRGNFKAYVQKIRSAELYVGMDSGGGHIAAVFGIPALLFFGTMRADYCAPVGNARQAVLETTEALTCRPCGGVVCTNTSYQVCLTGISRQAIVAGLNSVAG